MPVTELTRLSLRPVARTPLASSLQRLDSLVSPLTGIVASVGDIMRMADDARPAKVSCLVADQRPLVGTELDSRPGGSNPDPGAARAAAIGEAAERYAGSYVPLGRIRLGAARDLDAAVEPESFGLFSTEQYAQPGFPFVPFASATPVRWVDGFS
jgi:ribosomal protein S12 methylthiotransferase accessory factor